MKLLLKLISVLIVLIGLNCFDLFSKDIYEGYALNVLTHATSYANLLGILKSGKISSRKTIGWKWKWYKEYINKLNSLRIAFADPIMKNNFDLYISDDRVVYTELNADTSIFCSTDNSKISHEVILELPLSLLNRDDWHITQGWMYGRFIERDDENGVMGSASAASPVKVVHLIKGLNDKYLERKRLYPETDFDGGYWQNEVVFYHAITLPLQMKIHFATQALKEKLKKDLMSYPFKIDSEGPTVQGFYTLTIEKGESLI